MVRLIGKYERKNSSTRDSGEYIIDVTPVSSSQKRRTVWSTYDIRAVAFYPGEELEAIVLFVDTNRDAILEKPGLRYEDGFVPRKLYRYYIDYLKYNKKPHNIEPLPVLECFHSRKRGGRIEKTDFATYMERRVFPELLQDSESLFRDRKFINSLLKRI